MSTVHELKTDPGVFQLSWEGKKNWEIRSNDRAFAVGDRLILRETKYSGLDMKERGKPLEYTGRQIQACITTFVKGYGIEKGWVILSVEIEYRYAPGMIISSESSEPALFRINIGDEAEAQEDSIPEEYKCKRCKDTGFYSTSDDPNAYGLVACNCRYEPLLSLGSVLGALVPEQINETQTEEYMPEVGEVCEFRAKGGSLNNGENINWKQCELIVSTRAYVVLRHIGEEYSDIHECSHYLSRVEFRPIKSEREECVEELAEVIRSIPGGGNKTLAEGLYDAGYRLTEGV